MPDPSPAELKFYFPSGVLRQRNPVSRWEDHTPENAMEACPEGCVVHFTLTYTWDREPSPNGVLPDLLDEGSRVR